MARARLQNAALQAHALSKVEAVDGGDFDDVDTRWWKPLVQLNQSLAESAAPHSPRRMEADMQAKARNWERLLHQEQSRPWPPGIPRPDAPAVSM